MKRLFLFAPLIAASLLFAQDEIPERLLLTSGQQFGSGARALGLGGTFTGIADDYSAIWWNPAGLAQVKRIEVQGTLLRSGFSNEADFNGLSRDATTDATRLNNIGAVFPVPVYQGALSFAFGYSQVADFERRTRVVNGASQENTQAWNNFDELESGKLGLLSFATAVDISPNLSVGGGVNYWRGADDYSLIGDEYDNTGATYPVEQVLYTKLSGWNFNLGGMYRPGQLVRVGLAASTPFSMAVKEDWETGYNDYRMRYPWIWRFGASIAPGRWLVAADLEYRDWETLEFRTDTPFEGVTRAEANRQIRDTYRSTTRLSLGGEYLFPAYGLRGRAGYSFEPSNYKNAGDDADKGVLSLGMGILIDRSVMLDATFRTAGYSEEVTSGLTEDIRASQLLMTISYRM